MSTAIALSKKKDPARVCGDPSCPHPISEHEGYGNGGRPGHCKSPGCACGRWKRPKWQRRKTGAHRLKTLFKAPAVEHIPAASADPAFRRLVLQLGLVAMRDHIARLEEELR